MSVDPNILVLLFGPIIGGLTLAQLAGDLPNDGSSLSALLSLSYVVGLIPALLAAILDGIILWSYKSSDDEISVGFAVLLRAFSGSVIAVVLFFGMSFWSKNPELAPLLGYFAVFAVPGAVCGLFNKVVWR